MPSPSFQFLKHTEIDKKRWDDCIEKSTNNLIYATSTYLDGVAKNWDALVAENYAWVMPLTYRSKFGIRYLYQPAFTQQSGVFAANDSIAIQWREVITFLKNKYRFWEVSFNYHTPGNVFGDSISLTPATNYIVDLSRPYHEIRETYHKDLLRNLKRCQQFRLVAKPVDNYTEAVDEYQQAYGDRMKHVTPNDYNNFKEVCKQLSKQSKVICRKAVNQQNELMAIVLLLNDGSRLYNMMNTTTPAGRKVEANHFLMDSVIREFAGSDVLLDFEGSDLPGVKTFYENFGAVNQPYFMVKYNGLPWPIHLLKR